MQWGDTQGEASKTWRARSLSVAMAASFYKACSSSAMSMTNSRCCALRSVVADDSGWASRGRSLQEAQLGLDAVPASSRQLPHLAVGERAPRLPRRLLWAACVFTPWQWRPSVHSEGEGESPRAFSALVWMPRASTSMAFCSLE